MSQIHLTEELSATLGIRFFKQKRPEVFPLITGALESLDLAALELLEDLFPIREQAAMYGTDDAGDIRYLGSKSMNLAAVRVIRQMEQLELLVLPHNVSNYLICIVH